jgi:hypothetical protein
MNLATLRCYSGSGSSQHRITVMVFKVFDRNETVVAPCVDPDLEVVITMDETRLVFA